MTDMPEKINAWPSDVTPPDETALAGTWGVSRYPPEAETYTRLGIERNEALEAAAKQLECLLPECGAADPQDQTDRLIDNVRREDVRAISAMKREPK